MGSFEVLACGGRRTHPPRSAINPVRRTAQESALGNRELRLVEKHRETDDVVFFSFAARDGGSLPPFHAGQHLPIRLPMQTGASEGATPKVEWIERNYSISCAPRAELYRFTTKRLEGGLVSSWMHNQLSEGEIILTGTPQGDFCLRPPSDGPVFLIGAGVGITPLVSMLHE
jgi:ferredoxin-NADP reductase